MINSWLKRQISPLPDNAMKHIILGKEISYTPSTNEEEILFACGCFWGAEKGFWKLPGVITTAVGYAGGATQNPNYSQVCSGKTGHTEVVRVVWDKSIIDLSDLLKMFWECHDPTQGNRQGNDIGSQYRSAIYLSKNSQLELTLASLESYQSSLIKQGFSTITTEVKENQIFYIAEEYHQQYLARPGSRPYCSAMPTKVELSSFVGSRFKLPKTVWSNFNWNTSHCVLRSDNSPIKL